MTDQIVISNIESPPDLSVVTVDFVVRVAVVFDLDVQLQLLASGSGEELYSIHIRQAGWDIAWLPAGEYRVQVRPEFGALMDTRFLLRAALWSNANGKPVLESSQDLQLTADPRRPVPILRRPDWQLSSGKQGLDLKALSWNQGHDNWFFSHFDHAPRVVIQLMFNNSPSLKGKILDVGCGDGITDLGIFLRCQPELLVGIDPHQGYQRLPEIAAANFLPSDWQSDPRLQFKPADGNDIPYENDFFDVVLSWGSLEHIAGGYQATLEEIRRVLKPGGLLFAHPGLYYGPKGNHLGEFFDDPWIHLKLSEAELQQRVLSSTPNYLDRAGEFASADQYWQWYTELNRITVTDFEQQMRELGFQPWRAALRTANVVEFTDQLQQYSIADLCTGELYASFVLDK